mmetsp:Transcript_31246/g.96734  ORF Transcript_31246/g.96734 Transcript_31246/m.96734 type:complete len:210 (-) Transcript_31246:448-1077(-)
MVEALPHPREEFEDVRVVVHRRALVDEGVEARLGFFVQTVVEVLLRGREREFADFDLQRRQPQIRRALGLGPPQHDDVQDVRPQRPERARARARVPRELDRLQDFAVERVEVRHGRVAALLAVRAARAEAPVEHLAVAALAGAEVVRVRVDLEEAHERLELLHPILERRAREAPAPLRAQRERRLGRRRRKALDAVRLVQDDAAPAAAV